MHQSLVETLELLYDLELGGILAVLRSQRILNKPRGTITISN
jgi:hypothetical protein